MDKLSQDFTYDNHNRLDTADGAYGFDDYDYDPVGNRTSFTRGAYEEAYTAVPNSNRLDSIDADDNGSLSQRIFSYDAAGNVTADSRGYSYGYAQNNRLILAGGPHGGAWLFTNARGQRVITQPTSAGHSTRHYLYDEQGKLVMESDAGSGQVLKHYIWVDGRLLAVVARGTNAAGQSTAPAVYYAHTDHLGTPRKLTDGNAQVVWTAEYEPFGLASVNEDPDGDGTSIEFNLRFPGQYYDKYSGVNYNYFRDYDPSLGRYIQSDPIGLQGGLNTYAYVEGNPLSKSDFYGLTTYICERPLGGMPGTDSRNGPDFNVNPLFHQYGCVTVYGSTVCSSTTASSGGLSNVWPGPGSPGALTTPADGDIYHPQACTEVDDDSDHCVENCMMDYWLQPRTQYQIGPGGIDCQEYTQQGIQQCLQTCNNSAP